MPWSNDAKPRPILASKPGPKLGPWGEPTPPSREPDNDDRPAPERPSRRPKSSPPPDGLGPLLRRLRQALPPTPERSAATGLRTFAVAFGAIAGVWLLSGVYAVGPNEQGVVTTFGNWTRTDPPGAHYHLPFPIERVQTVAVGALKETKIDGAGDNPTASLMPTLDGNIADVGLTVHWRITDAGAYLFKLDDADAAVGAVAESAVREVVGRTTKDSLMGSGRGPAQDQVRALIQAGLDSYGVKIAVTDVQLRPGLPHAVLTSYQAVADARAYADDQERQARTYAATAASKAKGDAAVAVSAAQAASAQAIASAQGDAARFDALEAQYRLAPGATRERVYKETVQKVLSRAKTVVVDARGGAPIQLPPELFKPKAAGAATSTTPSSSAPSSSAPTAGAHR